MLSRAARALGLCLSPLACSSPAPPPGDGGESSTGSTTSATSGATIFTGVATLETGEGCTPTPTTSAGPSLGPACGDTSTTGEMDITPPTVAITHPSPDLVLSSAGDVHLTYTVEDQSCIVSAVVYIDGGMPRELAVPPYEAQLEDLPWGTPELTVEVTDAAGNVGISEPVSVRVCSGPKDPV